MSPLAIRALQIVGIVLCGSAYADSGGAAPPDPPSDANRQRDRDLSKRLIRKATTDTDGDVMSQVMSLMTDAEKRLVRGLDAGPETQAVQQRILERLDDAIATALQQRLPGRAQRMVQGERRKKPDQPPDKHEDQKGPPAEDAAEPGESTDAGTGTEPGTGRRGPFREFRRGWGHLPQRDRDELLQGIEEEFIEQYRPQIEQYYRALTEDEQDQ